MIDPDAIIKISMFGYQKENGIRDMLCGTGLPLRILTDEQVESQRKLFKKLYESEGFTAIYENFEIEVERSNVSIEKIS